MTFSRTAEQEVVCEALASGANVMVSALAGCAKTTSIVEALREAPKMPTFVVTFNKKNKEDMEKKLEEAGIPDRAEVKTLNGLGHQALARTLGRINLDNDKLYKLVKDVGLKGDDLQDTLTLVRTGRLRGIVPEGGLGNGLLPDTLETWQEIATELDIAEPTLPHVARDILKKSNKLGLAGTIDFDDQLYLSTLVTGSYPKTPRVIVDESQDLSPLNHLQLRKVASRQLMAVGDEHQAIYAWRGADAASMRNLRDLREQWTDCDLSTTFRCPKAVVFRQQSFVPKFTAAESNLPGRIQTLKEWSPIPGARSAIICRNNAPLVKLAFALLQERVPINFLGKDIGRDMKRFYNKVSNKGALSNAKILDKLAHMAIQPEANVDKIESLRILLETNEDIDKALAFLNENRHNAITLSTGHKAKGMEWENVYYLHPELVPSRHALAVGGPALDQEYNLRYVIETRTKSNLFFVRTEGLAI